MNALQDELGEGYALLGVNAIGEENDAIYAARTLPWLQDDEQTGAWDLWSASWRDVFVLDADRVLADRVNLNDMNLTESESYDQLKSILQGAASQAQ